MSTSKIGTVRFKLRASTTPSRLLKYLWTKLNSTSKDAITVRLNNATSTQRSQRRLSICIRKHACMEKPYVLLTNMRLTSFSPSMKITAGDPLSVSNPEPRSSTQRRFGKSQGTTKKRSTDISKLQRYILTTRTSLKRSGTVPSIWPWITLRTELQKWQAFWDNDFWSSSGSRQLLNSSKPSVS